MENIKLNTPNYIKKNDLLKLIAIITMVIDHMGYMGIIPQEHYYLSRTIGRIAFPIFAYYIALGFQRTSNLKKYISRIAGFALISQIPYSFFNPELEFHPLHLNIMFTLLIGLIALLFLERLISSFKEFNSYHHANNLLSLLVYFILTILAVLSPEIIKTGSHLKGINLHLDYGSYGVLLMISFYLFKNSKIATVISFILISIIGTYISAYNHILSLNGGNIINAFTNEYYLKQYFYSRKHISSLSGFWFQSRSILGLLFILLSDIWNSIDFRMNKYLAYLFYPVHIILLIIIVKVL
jgi:hypothetical protein